jgi:hypothetical protein
MAQILDAINNEWPVIADSPAAGRALMRWSSAHPLFASANDLDDVIARSYRPDAGAEVRRASHARRGTRRSARDRAWPSHQGGDVPCDLGFDVAGHNLEVGAPRSSVSFAMRSARSCQLRTAASLTRTAFTPVIAVFYASLIR